MCGCVNVRMCKCADVQMCGCANVQICECADVQKAEVGGQKRKTEVRRRKLEVGWDADVLLMCRYCRVFA